MLIICLISFISGIIIPFIIFYYLDELLFDKTLNNQLDLMRKLDQQYKKLNEMIKSGNIICQNCNKSFDSEDLPKVDSVVPTIQITIKEKEQ